MTAIPPGMVAETKAEAAKRMLLDGGDSGWVTLDQENGVEGTAFPIGTSWLPVNNWKDAQIIIDTCGLKGVTIVGDVTIIGEKTTGMIRLGK